MSRVVLVHGLGGSGKSRLLRHFKEMADGAVPDSPVSSGRVRTVWLDWEDEQRNQPGNYADVEGPTLTTVLDVVQKAVVSACCEGVRVGAQARQLFAAYRQGAARMPEYAAKFAEMLTHSQQPGSPFTSEDVAALLKSAVSAGLVVAGHPGGVLGLAPDQLAASAKAAGHLSVAATRAVTGKKSGEISPEEYDLVTDPARELTRRVAFALRLLARSTPLVILLDTGEVIGDRAWGWLRRVMAHTGDRVIWVVGARFETEAEAGIDSAVAQFVRQIGDKHLLLMSPTRFDDPMIREYLEYRTPDRGYTDTQIDMIAQFTKGLPLAISLSAELLQQGQQVENICLEADDRRPSSVVSQLARRYLIHAEQRTYQDNDPRRDDVQKILGLALVYGDLRSDPELLTTLWNVSDPLEAFHDLAQRHDFVLPVSRRLHDDVREILRSDLLDPYRRARTRAINQRALDLFNSRLEQLRTRWPTLDEQLGHAEFTTALLGKLWHTLWLNSQAGLDLFIALLPVLSIADPDTERAAATLVETFTGTFDEDQRRELDLFTTNQPVSFLDEWLAKRRTQATRPVRRAVKLTLSGHALQRLELDETECCIGKPDDRRIAVMILQARSQSEDSDERAVATLRSALDLTTSTRLRKTIGSQAKTIASRLVWGGVDRTSVPTVAGLAAAKIVTETLSNGDGWAWHTYAAALRELSRLDEALVAYDQALALDPNNFSAHNGRGIALVSLGRLDEGLAAYDESLALNSKDAGIHGNRGLALVWLGRLDEGLAAYDQALALNSALSNNHEGRGIALRRLGRSEEAVAAYDQALALDPNNGPIHSNRGVALVSLGRLDEAVAAYEHALALDPNDGAVHENKGIALAIMGKLDEALSSLDKADRLAPSGGGEGQLWAGAILWHKGDVVAARDHFARVDGLVTGCTPFRTVQIEALAACGLGHADRAEQRLLDALPLRAPGDRLDDYQALYDLLSNPPIPGIERLRSIAANDTDLPITGSR